jgi:hypothetical protein
LARGQYEIDNAKKHSKRKYSHENDYGGAAHLSPIWPSYQAHLALQFLNVGLESRQPRRRSVGGALGGLSVRSQLFTSRSHESNSLYPASRAHTPISRFPGGLTKTHFLQK